MKTTMFTLKFKGNPYQDNILLYKSQKKDPPIDYVDLNSICIYNLTYVKCFLNMFLTYVKVF